MAPLSLLFRIFYTSFYTLLSIVLFALLLIPPSDAIRQALTNKQLYNVFVIAASYFVTGVFAFLVYASRLYTTRSVLAAIPKTWIPIEEGDVTPKVRAMIGDGLKRSALVAWNSRPRVPVDASAAVNVELACPLPPTTTTTEPKTRRIARGYHKLLQKRRRRGHAADNSDVLVPSSDPVWGPIQHRGWSSPTSPDLANLQYAPVILELPHLVEAKAVSLSGPTPESLALLPRPAHLGLRDYIVYLLDLGVLDHEVPWLAFLDGYEYARFAGVGLEEEEFRMLMHLFADVLRGMRPLGGGEPPDESESESDIDDGATGSPTPEASIRSQRSGYSVASNSAASQATQENRGFRDEGRSEYEPSEYHTTSTPRGRKGRDAAVSSPSASWVSLSGDSMSSEGSVIRHPAVAEDGNGMLDVPLR